MSGRVEGLLLGWFMLVLGWFMLVLGWFMLVLSGCESAVVDG